MYIVIVGAGRVGLNLASFLISDGHDVTIIESDDKLCNNAVHELDALVICGSGTETKILEEANVADADVFVAATGNDEANLLSCILVRDHNIAKVIARVSDHNHEEAFKKAGINFVVSPELTTASYLEKLIIRPKILDLIVLGKGDAELLDITVTNSKVINKKVSEFSPTEDFIISAIHEDGNITIPVGDETLKEGCRISILVKSHSVKQVEKIFMN
ncbi:potassium channel family protein [Methanobacterium sp.]|uniref:potassium channel family protein n=1 Tax=Methanobacterium sp. TaxID=2164 RepID=UPI003C707CC6